VRKDAEMKLSRSFPRLTLLSLDPELQRGAFMTEPGGRGAKVASRAAAQQRARRQRQFDFGAMNPLVSDADMLESSPGVSVELTKVFRLADFPFIGDFALGTSQLSYSDPNLKGLIPLSLSLGVEIMAEAAQIVVPNRVLTTVENLQCRRLVSFDNGSVKLFVRAERVASGDPERAAVKVQLRDDTPNAAYTWPVMEAVFMLADEPLAPIPVAVEPLAKPRSVHWSGRDIYPSRLCCGRRLRTVQFVEAWCESGLDYEIAVPSLSGSVSFTSFPMWVVNPLLMEAMVSGFPLWRSHERFAGAVSFPFRMRRMDLRGIAPKEDSRLKCYMRLTGVTPKSHICDITVTDGNGKQLYCISGWEELTERVPGEYRELVMQPAMTFLTQIVPSAIVGAPATDVASAFITDVPYPIFERNEELWLKVLSRVILSASERRDFSEMKGSTSRRVEWLFGRVAAKEAVRRFLKDFYQARWSDADVQIWADDSGKPHALGAWSDFLTTKLDIAIAHTAQFVVAVAAANARVGVDVESSNRDLSEEFTAGVFTHDELELAAQAANPSQTIIRFWCAKEAVSKALGTGIRYSPREMVVADYLPDSGVLTMRLEGAWAEAFKRLKGRSITVSVGAMREHALAFCFIPASLFETA
jgi:phosphopantetheine--protein transferase-like protein